MSDQTKTKRRKRIAITYVFDLTDDRAAYLNFPSYIAKLGCPPQMLRHFVQTGRVSWLDVDGTVQVIKTAEVVHDT